MRCHEIDALTVLRAGPLTIGQDEAGEYSMARKSRQIVEHIISADTSALASTRVKKSPGDTVFKEGDKGQFMYHVEDGMIEIVHIEPFSKRSRQAVLLVKWRWLKKTDAEVQTRLFDATPHLY